jgi:hypothetical protein
MSPIPPTRSFSSRDPRIASFLPAACARKLFFDICSLIYTDMVPVVVIGMCGLTQTARLRRYENTCKRHTGSSTASSFSPISSRVGRKLLEARFQRRRVVLGELIRNTKLFHWRGFTNVYSNG